MMPNKMLVTDWFNRMTKKREREKIKKERTVYANYIYIGFFSSVVVPR